MSTQMITVGTVDVEQLQYKDQPVVTYEQIATVHGIPVRNVHRSFERNRDKFTEGKHYFRLEFAEVASLPLKVEANSNGMILFTERGYLLLTKPLRDKRAWEAQERMVAA